MMKYSVCVCVPFVLCALCVCVCSLINIISLIISNTTRHKEDGWLNT